MTQLLRGLERQVGISPLPDFANQSILRLAHALDHLLAGEAPVEVIAVGQKTAFPRHILDVARENVALQQTRDDLLGSQPLGNGELVLHHLPFDDRLHHVLDAGPLGEKILTRFKLGARVEREHAANEDEPMRIHDPLACEEVGDVHDAGARRDVDDFIFLQRARRFEAALPEDERASHDDEHKHQYGDDGIAYDHEWIARAPRRAGWHRHLIGLESGTGAARVDAFRLHD